MPGKFVTMSKQALMAHFRVSARGLQNMAARRNWRTATWVGGQKIFQVPATDLADKGDRRRRNALVDVSPYATATGRAAESRAERKRRREEADAARQAQLFDHAPPSASDQDRDPK